MYKPFQIAALFACAVIMAFNVGPALAAAPMAKAPAPGFYRIMLGDFEITALNDGTLDLPVDKILTNTTPDKVEQALAKSYLASPVETSFNGFLVNTGNKLVLVDTGAGTGFGPNLGKLVANLKAAGYQPEQVDEIYLTHMHADHIGGLIADGKLAFPNAIVRADKRESDYWLSEENMNKAPEGEKGATKSTFKKVATLLTPYIQAGKYKPFEGSVELTPGIRSYESPGHTPGHSGYVVESKGQKLMLAGDVIHVAAVQFEQPTVTVTFDSDSKEAEAERIKEFSDASRKGYLFAAAHLPFPALGHIREMGKGFQWLPVNFTQMH
ncbi:Organophosphate pesticide hydrolase [Collimonas arenae]|uniref:Organophosphate pesticide hydrolase n=2 Tax=Collimonas arenae TaxID=279058 RepID=A0A0A1F6M0_9BURK|nr:Organophosphate pesticide hydrolase [Collimonas arenae]